MSESPEDVKTDLTADNMAVTRFSLGLNQQPKDQEPKVKNFR